MGALFWGAVGAIGVLLYTWGGRHLLDWLLLPRVKDLWARRTKKVIAHPTVAMPTSGRLADSTNRMVS